MQIYIKKLKWEKKIQTGLFFFQSMFFSDRLFIVFMPIFANLYFMKFILKIIISSLAVYITSYMLPGVRLDNYLVAIVLALVLSFLNHFVKPLLILLTIPVTVTTFGLFLLAINAFIILFAEYIVEGFHVKSFWWAMVFSIVLSIITSMLEKLGQNKVYKETNSM